ncbi:MAG: XdhC/CoxI family protein [Pyrinomonadaceae bacterium]|nr:XdhC/CoxI family protein [Pyrinomonadaceae bacterium]
MQKELQLWRFIENCLNKGERVAVLVVAESTGSSPGRPGFKMAVTEDELVGSIGGGVMEVALVEDSRSQIRDSNGFPAHNPRPVKQVHRAESPNSSGMICSGEQTVIFFGLDPGHLETVQKIISALENRRHCGLHISDSKIQVSNSVEDDFRFEQKSEREFVYQERLGCKNQLFIVGGGHCALALSELISKLNFHISLFDDRPELNTLKKNEFVQEKTIIESYEKIAEYISSGENHYVVVMTIGYKFDEVVIRKLFEKDFGYFGVLGSKAKMARLLRTLEKEGFDKDRLDRIYTPIGLEISSQTPEEIAISIAAEIIAVKNKAQ